MLAFPRKPQKKDPGVEHNRRNKDACTKILVNGYLKTFTNLHVSQIIRDIKPPKHADIGEANDIGHKTTY